MNCLLQSVHGFSPTWFRKGVYARYGFLSTTFIFANGTWFKHEGSEAIFQWNCTNINQGNAEINVTLTYGQHTLSAQVYVNLDDRNVTLPNGAYLGKTYLWLVSTPANEETVQLTDGETVVVRYLGSVNTPQGFQQAYDGRKGRLGGIYDLDTGVLLQSLFTNEPTLLALNVSDPGYSGTSGITATNIDLGPRDLLMEIILLLPYVLPIIALILLSALVVRQLRKRAKRKVTLGKKTAAKRGLNRAR
jgi:hypothetical protein